MGDNSTAASTLCPAPLVLAADGAGIGGSPCILPYRSLLWSASEWQEGDRLMLGFTIVSFVSLSLVTLTWTLFPSKRRQHHLHMFMLCQFVIAFVFVCALAATDGRPSTIGLSLFDAVSAEQSAVCVFEASLLVFFVNAGVFWWSFIAFHLFLKVVLHVRLTAAQQNLATATYHAVSWLVSLILTVIAGANGWLGRSSVVPWCFFRDDAPSSADWLLFYIPIGVRGVVGIGMMLTVMWTLSRQSALTATMRRSRKGCARMLRPVLFIVQFLVIFFFLLLFRATLHFHSAQYEEDTAAYVQCLLTATGCGEAPVAAPVALFYLIIIATAGQGLVPGVIYLSQAGTLDLWRGLLTGQGLGGISRAGRGGESSINTTSRVGGAGVMSANTAVRRMSQRGSEVEARLKAKMPGRKGGSLSSAPPPLPASYRNTATLQASPTLSHSLPSPLPRQSLSSIETHFAGARLSHSQSPPPLPDPTASQRWYDAHVYGGAMDVQLADMGWREAGESVGSAARTQWTAQAVRLSMEEPVRPVDVEIDLRSPQPQILHDLTGLDVRDLWRAAQDLGAEGLGVGAGLENGEEKEEEYRVALPLDD